MIAAALTLAACGSDSPADTTPAEWATLSSNFESSLDTGCANMAPTVRDRCVTDANHTAGVLAQQLDSTHGPTADDAKQLSRQLTDATNAYTNCAPITCVDKATAVDDAAKAAWQRMNSAGESQS